MHWVFLNLLGIGLISWVKDWGHNPLLGTYIWFICWLDKQVDYWMKYLIVGHNSSRVGVSKFHNIDREGCSDLTLQLCHKRKEKKKIPSLQIGFSGNERVILECYRESREAWLSSIHQWGINFGIRAGDQLVSVFLRTLQILFPWICELDSWLKKKNRIKNGYKNERRKSRSKR